MEVTPEGPAERAAAIRRRWRRTALDATKRSNWAGWTPETAALISTGISTFLLLLVEPALWFPDWPPAWLGPRAVGGLALAGLVFLPLQGWLVDRFLSRNTPVERSLPLWLLAVRLAAACLPLSPFFLPPVWRALLERHPVWALSRCRRRPVLDLSRPTPLLRPSGRFLERLYLWSALGLLIPILWAYWLTRPGSLGPARGPILLVACAVLHLTAFTGARRCLLPLRKTRGGPVLRILPYLYLLPLPAPMVGLLAQDSLGGFPPGGETLVWKLWARRTSIRSLSSWVQVEETLRDRWRREPWFRQTSKPWGLERAREVGDLERALLSLYRRKTALLLLEGVALVAALSALGRRVPRLVSGLDAALRIATYLGIGLAAVGLAILASFAAASLLRLPWSRSDLRVFGRYLLLTHAAFLAGTQGGFLWTAGRERELGLLIGLSGALLAILSWFFFLPSFGGNYREGLPWITFFLGSAFLLGIPLVLDEKLGGWPGRLLWWPVVLTPFWSLLLFRRFGGWLLHPFSWRDLRDDRIPFRQRRILSFLAITAALPGGGLTIPAWILLRPRGESRGDDGTLARGPG